MRKKRSISKASEPPRLSTAEYRWTYFFVGLFFGWIITVVTYAIIDGNFFSGGIE
jgi:hypothetical protein